MKLLLLSLLLAATTTHAFQVSRSRPRPALSAVRFDEPSLYPYTLEFGRELTSKQTMPRKNWKQTMSQAATTFAEFRELQAAGLLNQPVSIDDAKRQAAQKFAVFAQQAQYDLSILNGATEGDVDADDRPTGLSHGVVRLAAALGKTTGTIFGGALPENYHD